MVDELRSLRLISLQRFGPRQPTELAHTIFGLARWSTSGRVDFSAIILLHVGGEWLWERFALLGQPWSTIAPVVRLDAALK